MRVSSKGCFPLQKHTEVISTFPRPVDKKGLQQFLGILNFYRRIPSSLTSCSHVFIREDTSKPPLSLLYKGPYLVLSKYPKYFLVQIGSKSDSVSVNRLKPVLSDHPLVPQLPPRLERPHQPSLLPVRRNPWREVRDKHQVLHQLHHLDAGGTPVAPLDAWNSVHNNLFVIV